MSAAGGYDEYAFVADLYDSVVPYRERPDVPFFVDAAIESDGPVLELGCGTGRVLIPTARAGVEVVGLDLSPHMLGVCRDRLGRESEPVRSRAHLAMADMRHFALLRRFALVTVPFRPFQHLITVQDQLACLTTVRDHLCEGGRVILDLFNPSLDALARQDQGQETAEEPAFSTSDGRRVVRRHKTVAHDRFNQVLQLELIYDVVHADGREERLVHAFAMRYLFRFEVEHLLARCGLAIEHLYAGFDKSAYGSTYPGELIVVARK
jgi:SAM-dependent methyltransferase